MVGEGYAGNATDRARGPSAKRDGDGRDGPRLRPAYDGSCGERPLGTVVATVVLT
jgi:hypothetical protein